MDYTDEEVIDELYYYLNKRVVVVSSLWTIDGFLMEDRHTNERYYVGKKGSFYLDCHTIYSENVYEIQLMEDYAIVIMDF